jgi:myosin heavy subunit
VGVSDLTLISKVSNEAINENLKKRFENAEIYVRQRLRRLDAPPYTGREQL